MIFSIGTKLVATIHFTFFGLFAYNDFRWVYKECTIVIRYSFIYPDLISTPTAFDNKFKINWNISRNNAKGILVEVFLYYVYIVHNRPIKILFVWWAILFCVRVYQIWFQFIAFYDWRFYELSRGIQFTYNHRGLYSIGRNRENGCVCK